MRAEQFRIKSSFECCYWFHFKLLLYWYKYIRVVCLCRYIGIQFLTMITVSLRYAIFFPISKGMFLISTSLQNDLQ